MSIFMIMIAYILGIIWGLYIKNIVSLFLIIIAILLIKKIINFKNMKQYKKFRKLKNLNKYIKILIPNKRLILILITFTISFTYICILEKSFKTKYKNIPEKIKIEAIVISNVKQKEYKDEYIIKINAIDSNRKYNRTHLKLSINNKKNKLEYGDKIIFTGEFKEPEAQRNYGGFDYKQYLKTQKIYGIVTTNKIEKIEKGKYNKLLILINKINQKIVDNSNEILEKEEASLLTGILIGNKENLSKDMQESFRNSNLSHILAVSGAHVTYVILGITFLLKKSKTNKKISKIITIFLLIIFIYLTGETPSVIRACIMAIYIIVR
ncbi:MAG: ComEC family DNA internalization-related competence protein [Clostridia bacterium]|nr:ComEC family DNA internalization-related competence protein [Clostridia bacterium]